MPEGRINVQTTGLFGVPEKSHKTDCLNSNNAAGHNPECPRCFPQPTRLERWIAARASQTVPYAEADDA